MNYKLLIGIPIAMVTIFVLIETPEYWWLLLAMPAVFLKMQMSSIKKSSGNSIYDEEYERIFASPPSDENHASIVIDANNDKKES